MHLEIDGFLAEDLKQINESNKKNAEPDSITLSNNKPLSISSDAKKIGRNAVCFCGSGKKHKHCHGKS